MAAASRNISILRAGIFILALVFSFAISAQEVKPIPRTLTPASGRVLKKPSLDTVNTSIIKPVSTISQDTTPAVPISKEHSPKKAVMLSLLPGAGQVYNGQAWKIPIIYAGLGTLGYLAYNNYTQMVKFRDDYLNCVHNGYTHSQLDGYASYPPESIGNMYQSYNKNFQLMVIISVGVYALNLVDAYVFGHLYDFQITDDLSMNLFPSIQTTISGSGVPFAAVPSFGVSLRF